MLNSTPIESELEHIYTRNDRAKIELTDNDINCILKQAKSKGEGERKVKIECKEKKMKRSASECLTLVVKKKEGKNVSNLKTRKRKKEAKISGDLEHKSLRECKE